MCEIKFCYYGVGINGTQSDDTKVCHVLILLSTGTDSILCVSFYVETTLFVYCFDFLKLKNLCLVGGTFNNHTKSVVGYNTLLTNTGVF